MSGPNTNDAYTVLIPNSPSIRKKANMSKMVLITVRQIDTLTGKPITSSKSLTTMAKPDVVPIISLLGTRK